VCGNTARVGNNDVGLGRIQSRTQAAMAHFGTYDLAVSPAGAAPEVLDVVFCHLASLEQSMDGCRSNER
jgi:hypothetical protein